MIIFVDKCINNSKDDIQVNLTKTEFEILKLLVKVPGKVYSRTQIFKEIWPTETDIKERTVDVHILNIRKKLGTNVIKTIKGVGYRLSINVKLVMKDNQQMFLTKV